MPVLEIDGIGRVEVGPEFSSLPPAKQAQEVDAIAALAISSAVRPNAQQDAPSPAPIAAPEMTAPPQDMSLGEMATSAVKNAPGSAVKFGQDLVQPVLHPIDTAIAIKNIGAGVLQKVGILSGEDKEQYADAVGRYFVDRYGSSEGIKKAIAEDPVGVLADVATVLTGGSAAAIKLPGTAGKVATVASKIGNAIDPVNAAVGASKAVGKGAATVVGAFGTGTGGQAIRAAAEAGAKGGAAADTFAGNLRGAAPIEDVVATAKTALDNMRAERGQAYRTAMADIGRDSTVLDFGKIDNAVADIQKVKTYKGQNLSPSTSEIRQKITDVIDEWKTLDPKEFHTAEGLDALKQKIGDIRDAAKYGTPERVVADRAYSAVRQTIVDQAPEYAKVMKGYEEASSLIKDIEKTLSLNANASIDTAVRKLQSTLRNNVNTNYGRREVLADYLVKHGAPHLIEAIAGQALNSMTPRGLNKLAASLVAAGGGAGMLSGVATIPGLVALGLIPLTSPRLVGEAAFAAGKASRKATETGRASFQIGRQSALQDQK